LVISWKEKSFTPGTTIGRRYLYRASRKGSRAKVFSRAYLYQVNVKARASFVRGRCLFSAHHPRRVLNKKSIPPHLCIDPRGILARKRVAFLRGNYITVCMYLLGFLVQRASRRQQNGRIGNAPLNCLMTHNSIFFLYVRVYPC